jgi:hypothetical protein
MAFGPRPDPSRPRTLGERLDFRLELDDQTLEALDSQHRELAERVAGLAGAVALLERLLLGTEVAR